MLAKLSPPERVTRHRAANRRSAWGLTVLLSMSAIWAMAPVEAAACARLPEQGIDAGGALAGDVQADGANSAGEIEAGLFVSRLAEEAMSCLTDSIAASQRRDELRRLLEENVDLPGTAKFVLGHYWRIASDSERSAFLRLLEDLILQASDAGSARYSGESLRVTEVRRVDDEDALVKSELALHGGQGLRVDWKLRRVAPRFKIQDVVIENISLSMILRDWFAAAVHQNGGTVAGLLSAMRALLTHSPAERH